MLCPTTSRVARHAMKYSAYPFRHTPVNIDREHPAGACATDARNSRRTQFSSIEMWIAEERAAMRGAEYTEKFARIGDIKWVI